MRSWTALRRLTSTERWLALRIAVTLPTVAALTRTLGLQRTLRLLGARADHGRPDHGPAAALSRARVTARLVRVVSTRGAFQASCLPQAITLWWLLRRRGLDADLRIGVRADASRLLAHAWVEHGGHVLNDDADIGRRFFPFESITAAVTARLA